MNPTQLYHKVRFISLIYGETAGLVFKAKDLEEMTISDISQRWPDSESMKMQQMQVSVGYDTQGEALKHQFNGEELADKITKTTDGRWIRG